MNASLEMPMYECVACSKMTPRRGYCEPCQALSVEILAAHDLNKDREFLLRPASMGIPLAEEYTGFSILDGMSEADWQDVLHPNEGSL